MGGHSGFLQPITFFVFLFLFLSYGQWWTNKLPHLDHLAVGDVDVYTPSRKKKTITAEYIRGGDTDTGIGL